MEITVYSLPICPNCDDLKNRLDESAIPYTVRDLEDDEVRMDLLLQSVTLVEAPIVCIDGVYMDKEQAAALIW